MLNYFLHTLINKKLNFLYSNNIKKYGFSYNGVFWNSNFNQKKRFEELLFQLKNFKKKKVEIADIGCGYGALYKFLKEKNMSEDIEYHGIDINNIFIDYCKKYFKKEFFFLGNFPNKMVDFSIMSGTYNLATTSSLSTWYKYIFTNLEKCLTFSRIGIIMNLQFSEKEKIKNNIFYADPYKIINYFYNSGFNIKCFDSKYFTKDKIYILTKKS